MSDSQESQQIVPAQTNPRLLKTAAGVVLLLVMVASAYWPAVSGDFVWDDDSYVSRNVLLSRGDGLSKIWFEIGATPQYYPLVFTSFWFEYRLWGLNPAGFHLVNICLHALSAVLLWRILRELNIGAAWLAAALFAVHPVHVESVAWITECKNTLSALFYLLSALCYLRWQNSTGVETGTRWREWRYGLSLVFMAMNMSPSSSASTIPGSPYW